MKENLKLEADKTQLKLELETIEKTTYKLRSEIEKRRMDIADLDRKLIRLNKVTEPIKRNKSPQSKSISNFGLGDLWTR